MNLRHYKFDLHSNFSFNSLIIDVNSVIYIIKSILNNMKIH